MSVCKLLQLYQSGHFTYCFEVFNKSNYVPTGLEGLDKYTKTYLFENNAIICGENVPRPKTKDSWSDRLESFISLYNRYRSFNSIPLDMELTVVSNLLWWFIIKSNGVEHEAALYLKTVLIDASTCITKVLKSSGDVAWTETGEIGLETKLIIASDLLLHLAPSVSLQLLSVITIAILISVKHRLYNSMKDYHRLIIKCINQLKLLKLHLQKEVVIGNEEIYLKFGFVYMNSSASLSTQPEVVDAFVIVGSLVCIVNNNLFDLALDYLKEVSATEIKSFKFLINYIRAHCYFKLEKYDEAKLCLAYSSSSAEAVEFEGYYRLLLANVLMAEEDYEAALVQCEVVMDCQPRLESLAAYLATNATLKLSLTTPHLLYLNKMVEILQVNCSEEHYNYESFVENCLGILNAQYSVTLQEALYLQARQLYLTGYHTKALDSYCQLIQHLMALPTGIRETKLLPLRVQIVHETILSHLKAKDLKEGENLCRLAIREDSCRRKNTELQGESVWEAALYSLEDDVVSIILLADILATTDKRKALDELNRCYNALNGRVRTETSTSSSGVMKEFCEWLMSRTLLRKAKLSDSGDAFHYYRRALLLKPGDKEVVFNYRQWALWNPHLETIDTGVEVRVFPIDQLHNLALKYILGCSVSEEEWAAVCDQESDHQVLDSLFDDDDEL